MSASPAFVSVVAALGDITWTDASVVGLIGSILVAIINNWGQSRRENRARKHAAGQTSTASVNVFAFVLLVASIGGLVVYFYNKANKVDATAGSVVTTPVPDPTGAPPSSDLPTAVPVPTSTVGAEDHLCWAFTVQLAARPVEDPDAAEFGSQVSALTQALPQTGPLHDSTSSTPVCNSGHFRLYYFGPFDDLDTAAAACAAIGQALHDSAAVSYSQFINAQGEIQYPFYFTNYGKKAVTAQGNLLLCSP